MVRGRISDEEWSLFEPFVVSKGPKSGRPESDHRLVLDGVFGLPEQEPHGVIFLGILVNGVLCAGNSEDGRYPGFGMQCLKH